MDAYVGVKPKTLIGKGYIECSNEMRLSQYEQEISESVLDLTLYEAIEKVYLDKGLPANEQSVLRDMGNYLFDPASDRDIPVRNLSGGQKARLQLIRLLLGSPNLLILDEPTNHLDLPSIEELENALIGFKGAVIYISHDSYFSAKLPAKELKI
jgi:ATP-binding cassette, subfamily F, member 3